MDSSRDIDPSSRTAEGCVESETDRRVAEAMELYLQQWEAGEAPDRQEFLRQYADIAEELADHLEGLEFICQAGPGVASSRDPESGGPSASLRPLAALGDFRIVREIGRGGMGVVYEAEQLSLGRTVALKVLPFAAMLDQKQRKRFQTEARAAALLEHPHIVPVYCIGEERGVTYYAMQLIRGMTVAELIKQLRREREAEAETGGSTPHRPLAARVREDRSDAPAGSGQGKNADAMDRSGVAPDQWNAPSGSERRSAESGSRRAARTSISTGSSTGRNAFVRMVARLGVQAAEALEHAHAPGIVHRDVKPANLMIDWNGKLYVMDFGLARIEADAGMTMTGAVLGTLRYMAPEQALSDRGAVDHRADVYSLGATLYELLTLRPALAGDDRQTLLKRIARHEPQPPRRLDRSIPADLETIVLRAMANEPQYRYRSAQELADDLKRFLEHKPIMAKRPSWWELGLKWSMRHQPTVWSALVILLLTAIGLAISTAVVARQKMATAEALRAAEENHVRSERHRQRAETAVDFSRTLLYVRDLSLAAHAHERGDAVRAAALMRDNPAFSERPDLRGFEWYYLRRAVMRNHVVVTSGKEAVRTVCYSPDGSAFATGHADGTVQLWNAARNVRRMSLTGHAALVQQVAYSPDGRVLASCSDDGTVRLWDAETGIERLRIDAAHEGTDVYSVAFSHDGALLATGGGDQRARLWNASDGKALGTLEGHAMAVRTVAFSPNDAVLATGSEDRTVCTWDVKTRRRMQTMKGQIGMVFAVTFSPDGQLVASGANDGTIRLWNVRSRQCELVIRGHHDAINSVAFFPGGHGIVASDRGGAVILWTIGRRIVDQFELEDYEKFSATAISPDGRQCAALVSDGRLLVRDVALAHTHLLGDRFPSARRVGSLAFSPDGQRLFCGRRMFAADPETVVGWREEKAYPGPVPTATALTPDGRLLAMARGGAIDVWDTRTRTRTGGFKTERRDVHGLCFAPHARWLATASTKGGVELWDASTGERQPVRTGHQRDARAVLFSRSGRYLASSDAHESVRVWDFTRQQPVRLFPGKRVHHADFSPDERFVLGALVDRTVRAWSLAEGVERGVVFRADRQHWFQSGFWKVRFSASGAELLCEESRRVSILDMTKRSATSDRSSTLLGHNGSVWSVAISPSGDRILSAGQDGTVRRWSLGSPGWGWLTGYRHNLQAVRDLAYLSDGSGVLVAENLQAMLHAVPSGRLRARLPTPPPDSDWTINAAAIGPDQREVAMGHHNGVVTLWDLVEPSRPRRVPAFPEAGDEVDVVAFSPDGRVLAAASRHGKRVGLWEVATGRPLEQFPADDCDALAFSPGGQRPAFCDGNDVTVVRLTRSGGTRRGVSSGGKSRPSADQVSRTRQDALPPVRLEAHACPVNALAFAPGGDVLATVGEDRKVVLWDAATYQKRWERIAHAARVLSTAFSPDGRTLATGSEDGAIKLWHVGLGEEILELPRAPTAVTKLLFSPTGHRLLAVLRSGRVLLFGGEE